jgi:hypothetical protein
MNELMGTLEGVDPNDPLVRAAMEEEEEEEEGKDGKAKDDKK